MPAQLIRTDKNGTKYFVDYRCDKCGGTGYIQYYSHIDSGICYLCNGTGVHASKWTERTPEHEAKLAERRLAKVRAGAEVKNTEFLLKHGFNQQGEIWLVLGDTYPIKDELKGLGAKFSSIFGWTFSSGAWAYPLRKVTKDDLVQLTYMAEEAPVETKLVTVDSNTGLYGFAPLDAITTHVHAIRKFYEQMNRPETSYVGQIGEHVELTLKMVKLFTYQTTFGTTCIYKFIDVDGNVLIWKTGYQELEQDKTYTVRGTVKEHGEYNGDKQTVLTRCKYMEVN